MSEKTSRRGLRPFQYFSIAVGASIGVAWIPLFGLWLGQAGLLGVLLAFFFASIAIGLVAIPYMFVVNSHPVSGGETAFGYEIFGRQVGFLTGWILAYTYIAVCIFEAVAVAMFANQLIPGIAGPTLYSVFGSDVGIGSLIVGAVCTLFLAYLHFEGTDWAARLQDVLTILLLSVCAIFVVVGLATGSTQRMDPLFVFNESGLPIAGILSVAAAAPLLTGGFNFAIQTIGDRAEDVSLKDIMVAIFLAIAVVGLFYIGLFSAAAMSMPREELLAADLPVAHAFNTVFGSELLGKSVLLVALLGLLTSWNGVILGLVRILTVLSEQNAIPAWFAKRHTRKGTRANSVLFISIVTLIGMLGGNGMLGPIIGSASITFTTTYLVVGLCALKLKQQGGSDLLGVSAATLWLSVFVIGVFVLIAFSQPLLATGSFTVPLSWYFILAWVALGAALLSLQRVSKSKLHSS